MIRFLEMCLLPTLTFIIANWKKRRFSIFSLGEWLIYTALLFGTVMITMVPMERASMLLDYDTGVPYIALGKVAVVFAVVLSVLLGFAARRVKACDMLRTQMQERKPRTWKGRIADILVHVVLLGMIVLTGCYLWTLSNYGNVNFEEMVFHLHMPLTGTTSTFSEDIVRHAILPSLGVFAILCFLLHVPFQKRYCMWVQGRSWFWMQVFPFRLSGMLTGAFFAAWLVILFAWADRSFAISEYLVNQVTQSSFIAEEYVDPRTVKLSFPPEGSRRNLITIYLESAETSSQDKENGGLFDVNYIPEMTRLAKENISFSHSEKIEGATVAPSCGWTVAALTAETAGLPLKLFRVDDGDINNSMQYYDDFLPGAVMMGDILKEAGYKTAFMAGSDFTFGGRRQMYTQHGDYEIYDHLRAPEEGVIPEGYNEFWGFEDVKLYGWAKEVLTQMAQEEQPFHFAMLTVDTHTPDAYRCEICPNTYATQVENALACSSKQLDEFITWCQAQPFYENTTIVVLGDHCSMIAAFYGETTKINHEGNVNRKVYNAWINTVQVPVQEENRLFTTMDFFPTTLASIGVEIEGDRLGLGTNLFSDRKTLAEEYGYEKMFKELSRKSNYYNSEFLYPKD